MMDIYRLSAFEASVLEQIELQPGHSIAEVSRHLSSRPHRVGHVIRKLGEHGVISKRALINPFALGLKVFALFFSLSVREKEQRLTVLKEIAKREGVSYVASYSGRIQAGIVIHALNLEEALTELEQVGMALQGRMRDKLVAMRANYYQFPSKYLNTPRKKTKLSLQLMPVGEAPKLSREEYTLISRLANSNVGSLRDLARELGQPSSTLEKRIQSLKNKKVLHGFYYDINVRRLGVLSYKILLTMPQCHPTVSEQVVAFATRNAQVVYLMRTLGSWDYEIGIECYAPADLNSVIDEIYGVLGQNVDRLEVLEEIEAFKFSLYPFSRHMQS